MKDKDISTIKQYETSRINPHNTECYSYFQQQELISDNIFFEGVSVYLLHVLGVILTFFENFGGFTLINFDLEPISTRTFTPTLQLFWPKLC